MTVRWTPLGEHAVLVDCPNEKEAFELSVAARQANWPWLVDLVQAYASVAIFFAELDHSQVVQAVEMLDTAVLTITPRRHVIPVCYERSLDLERVAEFTGLDRDKIIRLHGETTYTVYAIGFCPGFPYLGYLPPELANVPRQPSPRLRVAAGSVGLTGRQTGIYTEQRPGGWNIIGQTPLQLVDVADNYFPLATGDEVRFERVDEAEFGRLKGQRLV